MLKYTLHRAPSLSPWVLFSAWALLHMGDLNRASARARSPVRTPVLKSARHPSTHVVHSCARLDWIPGRTEGDPHQAWEAALGDRTARPEKGLALDGEWVTSLLDPRTGALTRRSGKAQANHSKVHRATPPCVQAPGRLPREKESLPPESGRGF